VQSATIGLIDKVFTRVGASDNISKGESTFMTEMTETASILNNLSDRSLVLMDEIGRGTSTYDGISIAWSIVEYLHNHSKVRSKTLFATHYHELNHLSAKLKRVKNFNVTVKEFEDKILFIRKLQPGGSEHSFGINVAQMAGMPKKVIKRACDVMKYLEKNKLKNQLDTKSIPESDLHLSLFEAEPTFIEIKNALKNLDINTLSPIEALLKINEIQKILQKKR